MTYGYDSLNRMSTVKESGTTTLATYSYDPLSRRTNLAFDDGGAMAYTYSSAGDLLTLNQSLPGTGTVPNYTLGYTNAHQLNSETSSQASYVWQPAAVATDAYTAANKLNQYPSWTPQGSSLQSFTYDLNGNLTGGTIAGAAWTYAYDPENRLITANKTSGGTVAATYAYDPLGRRNHKSGTGVTETYFVDDGTDEIAEYDATGTPVNRFVPGPAIDEPAAQIIVSGSHRRFFLTDHHGSTVAMVNASGNQVEGPYTYDSYGNCFSGGSPCGSSGTPYRFTGMRYDSETGLYFDRARYYSSALGRFYQVDPVGYKADLNLYTYGGNDPNDEFDPTGMTVYYLGVGGEAYYLGGGGGGGGIYFDTGTWEIGRYWKVEGGTGVGADVNVETGATSHTTNLKGGYWGTGGGVGPAGASVNVDSKHNTITSGSASFSGRFGTPFIYKLYRGVGGNACWFFCPKEGEQKKRAPRNHDGERNQKSIAFMSKSTESKSGQQRSARPGWSWENGVVSGEDCSYSGRTGGCK